MTMKAGGVTALSAVECGANLTCKICFIDVFFFIVAVAEPTCTTNPCATNVTCFQGISGQVCDAAPGKLAVLVFSFVSFLSFFNVVPAQKLHFLPSLAVTDQTVMYAYYATLGNKAGSLVWNTHDTLCSQNEISCNSNNFVTEM